MTLRRLAWTLRARGTDLAAWPPIDRAAALALARANPEARLLLADALAGDASPTPDPAAQLRLQSRLRHALAPASRGLRWGALAIGLCAGLYLGLEPEPEPAPDLAAAMQATTPATVLAAIDP